MRTTTPARPRLRSTKRIRRPTSNPSRSSRKARATAPNPGPRIRCAPRRAPEIERPEERPNPKSARRSRIRPTASSTDPASRCKRGRTPRRPRRICPGRRASSSSFVARPPAALRASRRRRCAAATGGSTGGGGCRFAVVRGPSRASSDSRPARALVKRHCSQPRWLSYPSECHSLPIPPLEMICKHNSKGPRKCRGPFRHSQRGPIWSNSTTLLSTERCSA
mmetsp:Transcript_24782/g.53680  ORF Transcript_24782/g.53680 Transcript_24782/m.53680 type:complete len:222 (-) Transcript_24782:1164-1829(-)